MEGAVTERHRTRQDFAAVWDPGWYNSAHRVRMGLMSKAALRAHCDRIGTSIDPIDLETR